LLEISSAGLCRCEYSRNVRLELLQHQLELIVRSIFSDERPN
jgi:hypothetical protein